MSLSRPLLIGLIASAALNVFLIGGVAGAVYVRMSSPPPLAPQAAPQPQTVYVPQATPQPTEPVETPTRPAKPAATTPPPVAPVQAVDPERQARPPLWTAGDRLSPESRRALRQALHAANQKNKPITRQARAERQAALDALASPGFDPAEVSRRLNTARTLDIQARGNVEAALSAYAATLSPQERAVLAQGLSRIYAPRKALRQGQE
ncbi:periplasmic heavy metal sensor [Caulobacter sp.]|uniref:periplasmic heavy metal sensor n=1 Tax=Caulobacter sp. TaxID=78 RepID=UPI001B198BBD|nr:periplasmic heavy metal sensor [Caulobacter sp.]MBO9545665.1 periplasmic heavy metal sensor [Caulobacter sp.]